MLHMFGVNGASCPRCERRNGVDARYCAGCGVILGAPRSKPVLVENRWVPAPDELAVFFGLRELSGLFVKTLRVPATARGFILQGDKATEVPQGEYELEGFFTRLNHLLRDQHAEILVTRTTALPVPFEFDDIPTCEQLAISVRFTVSIRIENVPAFARHFMTTPGTIGTPELRELLAHPVRQLALEFIGARSIREMAAGGALREELDERLQGGLKLLLADYGLAVTSVQTVELRHDKYDANRARVGSMWLAADEQHVQLAHKRHLDELYTAEEWQGIKRSEEEARLRIRRAELRQDDAIARAEMSLQGADRAHGVRARQIELYGRILEATSREQAMAQGAGDVLAELQHEAAQKGAQRADEAAQWQHLRALAGVHMRAEVASAQQEAQHARQSAQQRFSQQLLQQQIRHKIDQARLIEDATRQRDELIRLRESEAEAARRMRDIDEAEYQARYQALKLANDARLREAGRTQEWEDEQARQRIEGARRGASKLDCRGPAGQTAAHDRTRSIAGALAAGRDAARRRTPRRPGRSRPRGRAGTRNRACPAGAGTRRSTGRDGRYGQAGPGRCRECRRAGRLPQNARACRHGCRPVDGAGRRGRCRQGRPGRGGADGARRTGATRRRSRQGPAPPARPVDPPE